MGLRLVDHGVTSRPAKLCAIGLAIYITTFGLRASLQGISEHRMGQSIVAQHSIIGRIPTGERRVER